MMASGAVVGGDNEIYRAPQDLRRNKVAVFMCPSDPNAGSIIGPSHADGFQGNYVMCLGSASLGTYGSAGHVGPQNGMFFFQSATRIRDVTDGTSMTVMGSEGLSRGSGLEYGGAGQYWNGFWGGPFFNASQNPNTTVADRIHTCLTTTNPRVPCVTIGGTGTTAGVYARSMHVGGFHALMSDGAIRFVSDNIAFTIWQGLATRMGGEVLGEF